MSDHPVEALLRPPVELTTGGVAILCGAISWLSPELFLVTPSVGMGGGIALTLYGLWWLSRGLRVVKYQRNLRKLPRFEMAMSKVPVSRQWLYLGKGFEWQERHTQRLHDTRREKFRKYVQQNKFFRWVRGNEHLWESSFLYKLSHGDSIFNPVRPLPPVGGLSTLHGVELYEADIHMPLDDRTGHTLVLGTTRVGKTRLLEILVTQDIARGEVVIVIDPKGDPDLLARVKTEAERRGRGDQFYMFHLGFPEISARYNGIGAFTRITEIASRVAGQLSGEGNSAVFREFAWRFTNIIAKAEIALGRRPDYKMILRSVTNIDGLFVEYVMHINSECEGLAERIEYVTSTSNPKNTPRHLVGRPDIVIALETMLMEGEIESDDVLLGLQSALKYEKSYFDKIVASLLPLLEKLTTGKVSELLSPDYLDRDDPRPIFDWSQVVNNKGIIYIGLDALTDSAVSAAVGNSIFADLVSYAGERYKRGTRSTLRGDATDDATKINLHCDEFNELMGDEFIPMVNKAGGSGLQITAYTQTLADIEAKLGSSAKAQQVTGNFNNLVMFRVKGTETAKLLTDQLPEVQVASLTLVSGYNDSSDPDSEVDFTSRYEDRVSHTASTMIEPNDVEKLPKGQAFALLEGGKLYKIRLPLPQKEPGNKFEKDFSMMLEEMRGKYTTSNDWWTGAEA